MSAASEPRISDDLLRSAFLSAVLLTRSVGSAEAALLNAIQSWNPQEPADEAFRQEVVLASIRTDAEEYSESGHATLEFLPAELRELIELPARPRRCFVLRFLLGWPRDVCCAVLGMTSQDVDLYTDEAICSIALGAGSYVS